MLRHAIATMILGLLAAASTGAEASQARQPAALSAERGELRLAWTDGSVTRGEGLVVSS